MKILFKSLLYTLAILVLSFLYAATMMASVYFIGPNWGPIVVMFTILWIVIYGFMKDFERLTK